MISVFLDYLCHEVNCGTQCSGKKKKKNRSPCSFPAVALQVTTETLKPPFLQITR